MRFFEQEAPDLVVSMHPLTQNLPLRVLDTMARKPGPDGEVKPKIPCARGDAAQAKICM